MDPGATAEELGLESQDDVVLFVGRLCQFKDPVTLIRAMPLVLAQRPQTKFVVVGDGPLTAKLHTTVNNMGLGHALHFVGARGDVECFLALSKVFVALSPVENVWSMTIAEAMHMRVPCIITRAGQTEQVFTHGRDSYLVEPEDKVQLAKAIVYLLSEEDVRRQLTQGALALLQEHDRDTESIVRRMLALYQTAVDEKDVRR
jgi:glycosyltransferase involved in cell wall biosynthesis